MKDIDFYNRLAEAVGNGIARAIDGDDMFDTDDTVLNPMEADEDDSSVYSNHSKLYMALLKSDVIKRCNEEGISLSVISNDGNEYDVTDNIQNADNVGVVRFLRFGMDALRNGIEGTDNSIVFSVRWKEHFDKINIVDSYYVDGGWKWQDELGAVRRSYLKIEDAEEDCDGYANTMHAIEIVTANGEKYRDYLPAMSRAYDLMEELNGSKIRAYLPALGQMLFMFSNQKLINDVLTLLGIDNIPLTEHFWTSTEYDANFACTFMYGIVETEYKDEMSLFVFPLFYLPKGKSAQPLHERLTEAIADGISKAIDDDDLFGSDEQFMNPVEDAVEDASMYQNHSKKYLEIQNYLNGEWSVLRNDDDMTNVELSVFRNNMTDEAFELLTYILHNWRRFDADLMGIVNEWNLVDKLLKCTVGWSSQAYDGYRIIGMYRGGERRQNYLDEDNVLLSDKWYGMCRAFCNGFGAVADHVGEWNFLDVNGEYVSDEWFTDCQNFFEGFASVRVARGGWNYIDTKGNYLCDDWFDECHSFQDGYGRVLMSGYTNYVDRNGNLIADDWLDYDSCGDFHDGFAIVDKDGMSNYIDCHGRCISDKWFDMCSSFYNGFAIVELQGKKNYMDKEGKMLSDTWYPVCKHFGGKFAIVGKDLKYNYIDRKGQLLSKVWFDSCDVFQGKYALVTLDDRQLLLDETGQLHAVK